MKNKTVNLTIFALTILLLISNCAMIPPVNKQRIDEITRGPDFAPYFGLKKRIAVMDFENLSNFGDKKMGSAFADMLVSQLSRSDRFVLIERSQLEKIMQEQAIGQSGIMTEETAAQVGQLLGVESIIIGKILQAGQETESHDIDNKKNKWSLALKSTMGHILVSYRMISTTSGEILLADQVSAKEIKPAFGLKTKDVDFSNLFEFDQTVVGIAFRKAVNKITVDIVNNVEKVTWQGKIVQAKSDTTVYFTPGSVSGVKVGQFFNVFNDTNSTETVKSKIATDNYHPKARIEATGFIGDKVTRARVVTGRGIQRGDLVKLVKIIEKPVPK